MRADPGLIERGPGQRDIGQAGPQASGGNGEVSLAEADLDGRVAAAEGGRQTGAGLLGAVGQDPDGEGGGARVAATRARTCSACSSSRRASP